MFVEVRYRRSNPAVAKGRQDHWKLECVARLIWRVNVSEWSDLIVIALQKEALMNTMG